MFILISSISPSDRSALRFLVEHFSLGMHKNETDRAKKVLHNPYGAPVSSAVKLESKNVTLAGPDAVSSFKRESTFGEEMQYLTIKVYF
jgi:hypothetical protein